jgi:DNA replication protein DnaC
VRPCPWCGEVLEPTAEAHILPRLKGKTWWKPGLIGHSCPGYDEEKAKQTERLAEIEERKREERWESICRLAGMSGRRLDMALESFERERQPEAYREAEHFFIEPKSLVFCGDVGTGKTHLACGILQRWMRTGFEREMEEPWGPYAGGRGLFITLPRLLLRIQATYKAQYSTETEDSIIEYLCDLPLLVLDDVGKQKRSDYSQRTLFNIVDGRYVKGKHIVITSNLSGDEFAAEVGEAVASRLIEMGKTVVMRPLRDYRKEMSAARKAGTGLWDKEEG